MAKTCWFGSDIALPETLIEDAEAIQTLRRKSGIMLRAVYGIMRISQILAKYAVDDRNGKLSAIYAAIIKMVSDSSTMQTKVEHREGGKKSSVSFPDEQVFREGAHAQPAAAAEALLDSAFPDVVIWAEEDRKAVKTLLERGLGKDAVARDATFALVCDRLRACAVSMSSPLKQKSSPDAAASALAKIGLAGVDALERDLRAFTQRVSAHGQKNLLLYAAQYNKVFMETAKASPPKQ